MATQTLLTFEQYADLPDQEGIFLRELDEGVVIEMPQPSFLHGQIQGNVFALLKQGVQETGTDFVISQNAGFRLAPNVVRAPDVCLVRRASLQAMEVVKGGSRRGAPELAAEVVSESDTAIGMQRKVEQYLRAGATAVWILYADPRNLIVYRRSGEIQRLEPGQSFQEAELLPGFTIQVNAIFAGIY